MLRNTLGSLLLFSHVEAALAQTVEFDSSFAVGFDSSLGSTDVDVSSLLLEDDIGPGTYHIGISVNRDYFGQRELRLFRKDQALVACLSPALLKEAGIKASALLNRTEQAQECIDLPTLIDGASVSLDSQKLLLDISVPQIAMDSDARGYLPPTAWDSGINAGFLNYRFSGSHSKNQQQKQTGYNLYIDGGLNLGGWRLRSSSSYQNSGVWERAATYVQRDLPGTAGTLTVGESVTPGDMFQSIPFRGIQLSTDVEMLPDSLQGYAPIIHGVAQTQAKVEVRQHGYSLYTSYVAPGPFEIRDLNAASGSGDLEVIITEADGSQQRFTQPYATLGNLLRQGTWRYGFTAGQYHENNRIAEQPVFTQATLAYGLPKDYTLALGGLFSENYRAWQLGVGKGLGSFGAISLDVTQAATQTMTSNLSGRSYGIRYGKLFATGTDLRFAGYRYSTEHYRDFAESISERSYSSSRYGQYRGGSKRSRLEATLSQRFASQLSVYLNFSQQYYWGGGPQDRQLQLGLNTQLSRVNIGLYASKSLSQTPHEGAQVGLTFSFPMGGESTSVSLNRNADGTQNQRFGLNGGVDQYNDMTYSVDMTRSEAAANTASASVGYRAPWAQLNGGATHSSDYNSVNIGVAGSVLAHADGIELGQSLGETMALVHVKDTPNLGVNNAPGSLTNAKGYSLVPYIRPYRKNRISLDTHQLDANTDIDKGVTTVIPRRGAVVLANFDVSRSEKVLMILKQSNGLFVPFGAAVLNAAGEKVNVIGQGGQVLVSVSDSSRFFVRWGGNADQHCQFDIDMQNLTLLEGLNVSNELCRMGSQ